VQDYFDSSMVRGEGNPVIKIYKPGNPSRTRGRAYLFHIFLTTKRNFIEIQITITLIIIICEILLFIYFILILEIKIHKAGIGALYGKNAIYSHIE